MWLTLCCILDVLVIWLTEVPTYAKESCGGVQRRRRLVDHQFQARRAQTVRGVDDAHAGQLCARHTVAFMTRDRTKQCGKLMLRISFWPARLIPAHGNGSEPDW